MISVYKKIFAFYVGIAPLLLGSVCIASSGIWDRAVILQFGNSTTYPGANFNNLSLGSYVNTATYTLKGGYIKTYKNGSDDITGAQLYYRVVPAGGATGVSFTSVPLPFFQNLSGTPGDQQWQENGISVPFMSGLPPGNYFLEIYFEATFTSIGGSGVHTDNNAGANYKASFSIIGAPPSCTVNLGNDTSFCGASGVVLGGNFVTTPDGDSLTITYDATQGQSGLAGAAKVYFHSGYELTAGAGAVGWTGNWGQDDGLGKMDSLGNNLWRIKIHPQSYYNLAPGTLLHGLFFVFRNADGTATGKDNNGNDIFMLYGSTPSSAFQGVTGQRYVAPYTGVLWSNGATSPSLPVSETGTYWIQVSYSNGCVASDTIQIQSGTLPIVNILGNTSICPGQSTTLTADGSFSSYSWSNGSTGNSITVNSPGEYSVSVTNASGCQGIDVAFVNQTSLPIADFTYSVFNTNTVNFSILNPVAGQTYKWTFGNGNSSTLTTAATSQTYNSNGVYPVRLVVQNSCGSDTIVKMVTIIGLGIDDATFSNFRLYPLPVENILSVEIPEEFTSPLVTRLTDMCGNLLEEQQSINRNLLKINMEGFAPGMYFISLQSKNRLITKKIIKQ